MCSQELVLNLILSQLNLVQVLVSCFLKYWLVSSSHIRLCLKAIFSLHIFLIDFHMHVSTLRILHVSSPILSNNNHLMLYSFNVGCTLRILSLLRHLRSLTEIFNVTFLLELLQSCV
jgi:hypothetical protein